MKHKLLTLASAAALLAACSDTAVSDANDEIKEKGIVTFFVYDVLTRMPLEDVANYYRTEDKTKYTDSTGTIVWKNVDIGQSYFDFQLDGYAMKRHNVKVTDKIQHDVARVEDNVEKVPMYELGVDVKGKFYYIDPETQNWIPAANATIYVDYPDDSEIYPNEVYTTTDEDGAYEFKNLAANVGFSVKSMRFSVDSVVYEVDSIGATAQRKGVLKEMDPIAAKVASLVPVLLSSNLNNVGTKDAVKLNFSEVLEKDSVTTKHINVKRIVDDTTDPITTNDVAVTLSLSDDGKTVTVKSNSGAWADGKDYIINFKVWSKLAKELKDSVVIDGVEYKFQRKFTAGALAVPGKVKDVAIDLNDDDTKKVNFSYTGEYDFESAADGTSDLAYDVNITIKWTPLEKNVDRYNVYIKGDKDADADYMWVADALGSDSTTSFNLTDVFNNGNNLMYPQHKLQSGKISVIVLAKNSAGEGLAKDATPLEIDTYKLVQENVKTQQTNGYIDVQEVSVKLDALYDCTSADACSSTPFAGKGTALASSHYAADLIVVGTPVDKYDKKGQYAYPNGYDLFYLSSDGWVKIEESTSPSIKVAAGTKNTPFEKALEYDKGTTKRFKFAIVPFFTDVMGGPVGCSDGISTTKTACEAAFETWTSWSVYKISQTSEDEKGVFTANNNLQDLIDDWNK